MDVLIRPVQQGDFNVIKSVISEGLYEHYLSVYMNTAFWSIKVQSAMFILSGALSRVLYSDVACGFAVYFFLQLLGLFCAKHLWRQHMDEDMKELATWKRFTDFYCNDSGGGFWVAMDTMTSAVVGSIGVKFRPDLKTLEIKRLSVSAKHRRSGIGGKLLMKLLDHCDKMKEEEESNLRGITLLVNVTQQDAIRPNCFRISVLYKPYCNAFTNEFVEKRLL
ncbi:N-acetyltransferase 8-like [Clavelina lepadiformis]|uniref:N-acetyltransferase 8-like n=1 Tax=Clavelina lepadiformis TaxID=159417 RepID=UPI004042CBD0